MSARHPGQSSSSTSLVQLRLLADPGHEHPARMASLALRSRSPEVLDALVECAGGGPEGIAGLRRHGTTAVPAAMLTRHTGPYTVALATALAGLQPVSADAQLAIGLARAAVEQDQLHWWWPRASVVAVQNAVLCGAFDEASTWVGLLPDLPLPVRWGTLADLANPYLPMRTDQGASAESVGEEQHRAWEEALSVPFQRGGLVTVRVDPGADELFDGLTAASTPESVDGPLVTVVMPTYAPDAGLLTSVRSLLAQSYGNLEILLVDDCSGEAFSETYDEAAALDDRITLIRLPVNGGSYLARNEAMARARGEFITFQDGDDWSHPERIARQVSVLRKDPARPASLSRAVRATDHLRYTWLGFSPQRSNASSLMLTRDTLERLGPFQRVRKGADSEYHKRIEAVLGDLAHVPKSLAVTRLREGSLSRADFRLDWHVPDRVNYRNVFGHWHRTRSESETPVSAAAGSPQPFPPPRSFLRKLPDAEELRTAYDLAYLLDASLEGPLPGDSPAVPVGVTDGEVAVVHREDFGLARSHWHPFRTELLERVQTGVVDLVSTTDPVHFRTLVVLHPGALELDDDTGIACTADRVLVTVPLPDEEERFVDLLHVSDTCRALFGTSPQWVALDERTQQAWATDNWDLPLLSSLIPAFVGVASDAAVTEVSPSQD